MTITFLSFLTDDVAMRGQAAVPQAPSPAGIGFCLLHCSDCCVLDPHTCYIQVDGKVRWAGTGLTYHPEQEPAPIPPLGLGLLLLPGGMRELLSSAWQETLGWRGRKRCGGHGFLPG